MTEMCAICGAPEASAATLIEHMRTVHAHDDPAKDVELNPESHIPGLVCALCGRRFASPMALANHNLQPHPTNRGGRTTDPTPG